MSIKCLMNGLEVNYPCSPSCALFGDCVTVFESQKKANVRTNADRIRAMSNEELAKMLYNLSDMLWCRELPECIDIASIEDEIPVEKCIGCALAWLQHPAE